MVLFIFVCGVHLRCDHLLHFLFFNSFLSQLKRLYHQHHSNPRRHHNPFILIITTVFICVISITLSSSLFKTGMIVIDWLIDKGLAEWWLRIEVGYLFSGSWLFMILSLQSSFSFFLWFVCLLLISCSSRDNSSTYLLLFLTSFLLWPSSIVIGEESMRDKWWLLIVILIIVIELFLFLSFLLSYLLSSSHIKTKQTRLTSSK